MKTKKIKPMFSLTRYLQANATRKLDKAEFREKRREAKKEAAALNHNHPLTIHDHSHEHNEEYVHTEEDHGEE